MFSTVIYFVLTLLQYFKNILYKQKRQKGACSLSTVLGPDVELNYSETVTGKFQLRSYYLGI